MELSQLKKNAAAAAEGRWRKDLPGLGNIEVLVRGTNTPAYRRRLQALVRALPPAKRKNGIVDPVEMDRITGICLAEVALQDWKNVDGDDKKPIPFTVETARRFLTDPDLADFRDGVLTAAGSVDDEDGEASEELEKN